MRGAADDLGLPRRIGFPRILEQPEVEFEGQYPRHCLVDGADVDAAGLYSSLSGLEELGSVHDEVVTGVYGDRGGRLVVLDDVLLPDHPAHVVPIGDERALEAPLALEHVVEQPTVGGHGYAVDGLVAEHEGAASGLRRLLERRQEPGAQLARAQVGLAGIAATLGLRVAREVLGSGEHRGTVAEAVALISADHRDAELADQVRVFTEGLVDATPARIPGDTQHRRECPVQSGGCDFASGGAGGALNQLGIPGACHPKLRRKDGGTRPEGVAVNRVIRHEQRDLQASALHELARLENPLRRGMQQRAAELGQDQVFEVPARVELEHLPHLLGQSHPGEQVGHARRSRLRGVEIRRGSRGHDRCPRLLRACSICAREVS